MIDIAKPEELVAASSLVSNNRFNLYTFDERKYLRGERGDLVDKVRNKFMSLGAKLSGSERIFLLGQLKNCGIYFSPLNLYLCFIDTQCQYVLAEVSNTPWNERHYYLLDMQNKQYITQKNFHVSPFWNMQQDYHWSFTLTKSSIKFQIDSFVQQDKVFSAGYQVELLPLSDKQTNNRRIMQQPFVVFKIICAIYYQALKLFIKRVPFVPYQKARN